jgi:CheY-like chemotaxis protein/two-component sensor histidine kinase
LRTPLNAIIAPSEMLMQEKVSTEQRELMKMINDSANHLLSLISDILDLSRIESGKTEVTPQPVDITNWLTRELAPYQLLAQSKRLQTKIHFADNLPHSINIDPCLVLQIVINIVGNAIKFTESGSVNVDVSWVNNLTDDEQSGTLCIKITDTGPGIPQDLQKKIFDAFQQGDSPAVRKQSGTGLGLAISRKLAELMGGSVELVKSSPQGTVFQCTLPAVVVELEQKFDSSSAVSDNQNSPPSVLELQNKLLLVEDDHRNVKILSLMLRRIGIEMECAYSGEEALELTRGRHFPIILMDIRLPGIDGIETARRILANTPNSPPHIIALTAHAMAEYKERSLEAGMRDFLTKPVTVEQLRTALSRAVNN